MEKDPHNTFIVRIWWTDPRPGVQTRPWYGRVDHLQSGQSMIFRDLQSLIRFIQAWGGPGLQVTPAADDP